MSVTKVIRGSFWLYLSSIVNNLSGFFYWLIISTVAGSRVLGITSVIVGFASLVNAILNMGIGQGTIRFFGKVIWSNDKKRLSEYFWSSFMFMLSVYGLASLAILLLSQSGLTLYNLKSDFLKFASIYILLGIAVVPRSLVVSLLRTDIQFISTLIGGILKFVVGVALVLNGWDWVGAVIGYMCPGICGLIINSYYAIRRVGMNVVISYTALKDVITAGVVSWLPVTITLLGQWLGVLTVFSHAGAVETGHYFVAYAIFSVVTMIGSTMLTLLFPVLSGLTDGRKRMASRILNISLTISFPVAIFVMLYPWFPLSLLGREYAITSGTLLVLLLSIVPNIMNSCVIYLVYAYGYYSKVLMAGLAINVPRVVFYQLLTPIYGGLGAAISFTIGSFIGITYVLILAHKVNFKIDWLNVSRILAIPVSIGLIVYLLRLPWFVGSLLVPISLILYIKFKILTKRDLKDLAKALWLEPLLEKMYTRYKGFFDLIID